METIKKFKDSKELNDAIKSGKVKHFDKVILDERIIEVLFPQMKRMRYLINKNYSPKDNEGTVFMLMVIFSGLGMIIYGGFTKNWASIVSGALMISLVLIA